MCTASHGSLSFTCPPRYGAPDRARARSTVVPGTIGAVWGPWWRPTAWRSWQESWATWARNLGASSWSPNWNGVMGDFGTPLCQSLSTHKVICWVLRSWDL